MVRVGTTLEIQTHSRLEDGRLMIASKGLDRFKIVSILREQPIMVCEVEPYIDIEDTADSELRTLSDEVCELYKNVVKLSKKVKNNGKDMENVSYNEPEEFSELTPTGLSFWFASLFLESPFEQQKLLEEQSSNLRLQREKKLFEDALKYLTAASALQGAFNPDDKTEDIN
eukprot:g8059.t1